jgi:hypothetical protein
MAQKARGADKSKTPVSAAKIPSRWHAVVIRPKGSSCEAVQACRSARFLSAEAPRLPLSQCTASDTCRCVYSHYVDRRANPRRGDEKGGLRRDSNVQQERRLQADRRKSD